MSLKNILLKSIASGGTKRSLGTDLLNSLFGEKGIYSNLFNKYLGTGMTEGDREAAYLNHQFEQENMKAEQDWTEYFYNKYQSAPAQVAQYQEAGLNPMLLAGGAAGASAATSPAASSSAAAGSTQGGDILSSLMSSIFKAKDLELQQQLGNRELDIKEALGEKELELKDKEVAAGVAKSAAETEGINIQNKNLQELLDLQKGELTEKISFLGQQIETEPVKRALLAAEVGVQKARQSLITYQAQFAKAQAKYGDAYWSALVHGSELMNEWQATTNDFQRSLIKQQIDMNNAQLTGMILNNGMLAKDFGYYESNRRYSRVVGGISAGASALSAIGSVALGAGGMLLGAGKGIARGSFSQPSYHVKLGQGVNGLNPYDSPYNFDND